MSKIFIPHPMSLIGGIDRCDANNPILIPKIEYSDETTAPGWIPIKQYGSEKWVKPLIRCKCGVESGIRLHHVYADGRVMNSLLCSHCCGWHVYVKLADYSLGEFLPGKD